MSGGIIRAEMSHDSALPAPVSTIRNLGPASDAAFARAGLTSADAVRALGPDEAYLRLLRAGTSPHFIGYYALVMGLQGRPWNDCHGAEKAALREPLRRVEGRGTTRRRQRNRRYP